MESKGRPGMGDMREESALNMFRQMDLKGKVKDDTQLKTVHQNTIATIRTYDEAGGLVKKFSSKFSFSPECFSYWFLTLSSEWRRWESSHMVGIVDKKTNYSQRTIPPHM